MGVAVIINITFVPFIMGFVLCCALLCCAVLYCVVLCSVVLCCAVLCSALPCCSILHTAVQKIESLCYFIILGGYFFAYDPWMPFQIFILMLMLELAVTILTTGYLEIMTLFQVLAFTNFYMTDYRTSYLMLMFIYGRLFVA